MRLSGDKGLLGRVGTLVLRMAPVLKQASSTCTARMHLSENTLSDDMALPAHWFWCLCWAAPDIMTPDSLSGDCDTANSSEGNDVSRCHVQNHQLEKGSSPPLLADKVPCCQNTTKAPRGRLSGETNTWTERGRTDTGTDTRTDTHTDRQTEIHTQTDIKGRRRKMTLALAKPCSAAAVHSQSLETRHSSAAVV